jgi:cardiolipin synthase
MRAALQYARARGVRVQLVLPTRSDNRLALWAGRSFYGELVRSGVEVHEFDAGMLHSKIVTIDDRWCMIGSANMDVRSFYLNYEVTALFYDRRLTLDLAEVFTRELARALEVRPEARRQLSLPRRLGEGFARLLSPLL